MAFGKKMNLKRRKKKSLAQQSKQILILMTVILVIILGGCTYVLNKWADLRTDEPDGTVVCAGA